jgi:hypothetical protein
MDVKPSLKAQKCPCCGQNVKLYQRTLTNVMLSYLEVLQENNGLVAREWEQLATEAGVVHGGGDKAKLMYWGLVKKHKGGRYFITDTGKAFLDGKVNVPRYVYVYNNEVKATSPEQMYRDDVRSFCFAIL